MGKKKVPFKGSDVYDTSEDDIDVLADDGSLVFYVPAPVLELLIEPQHVGQKACERPTLTIWFDGNHCRGTLHDRFGHAVTYAAGASFLAVLRRLSEAVEQPDGKWRASPS